VLLATWLAETTPTDRQALQELYDQALTAFSSTFGQPIQEIDAAGAPKAEWHVASVRVSLDCFWNGPAIGVIALSIEPGEKN
jgi:hypothetical protein